MTRHSERGVALVLALLITSVMSVLAVSLTFLSQTETFATMNYRMMTQSRFAGEAAVQKAGTFLMDTVAFPGPGSAGDPLSAYNRTVSPVTYNGTPVVLDATGGTSNYPVSSKITAFQDLFSNQMLQAGYANLTYKAKAELISLQSFEAYGGAAGVAATWKVTGIGALQNSPNSTVTVTSIIERPKVPANMYAAFATGNTCGAMYYHGDVTINSYDSRATPAGSVPTTQNWGGNVGTNGNLHIQGSVLVQGNLSTPRTGVGSCSAGAVTALTETGAADVRGSVIRLPGEAVYPVPVFTAPTTAVTIDTASLASPSTLCTSLGLTLGTNCSVDTTTTPPRVIVDPNDGAGHGATVTMPSLTVESGVALVFKGRSGPSAEVNLNSLVVSGGGRVEVEANMGATHANEAVVLKFAGKNADGTDMTTPFQLSDLGWKQNSPNYSYDASSLQIVYGGTGQISMYGNAQSAATIYAPNASFLLQGTTDLYGSVLARTVTNGGNASIHFDRRLLADFSVPGRPMASNFSWEAY